MSRFVDTPRVLIIRLWLKRLDIRTVIESRNAHANGNRTCQRTQLSRIIRLSRNRTWVTECHLNACRMTCDCLSNFSTQGSQVIGQVLYLYFNCPPVSHNGTSNQCACFTERPSNEGCITTMVMMQVLAACPSGKLGSTSSPAAPRVPPGFIPK